MLSTLPDIYIYIYTSPEKNFNLLEPEGIDLESKFLIDFNGMSTGLALFYTRWLEILVHYTFIFTFFFSVFVQVFGGYFFSTQSYQIQIFSKQIYLTH